MSDFKLSVYLRRSRIDRPDEWIMDEFARQAENLEKQLAAANEVVEAAKEYIEPHDGSWHMMLKSKLEEALSKY